MVVGIVFANSGVYADPQMAALLAQTAEANGVESLWTVEHVTIPKDYESQYPYSSSGRAPGAETSDIPDPLIWLAYVAAVTTRIKLATGILILPQRNPLVVAKEIATLDKLSAGRAIIGVGSGWLEEEFSALDVSFHDRGERLDDYISALRTIWRDGAAGASHHSSFANFDACISLPQPAGPTVPIVIGGHTKRAARRAGELGDGFFPGKGTPDELGELVDIVHESARRVGRNPDTIELTTGLPRDSDATNRLVDLGFTRFTVPPPAWDLDSLPNAMERLGQRIDDLG